MRKGQTEIFGLVIVVLLVSLLMIMVLVFVVNNRGSDIQQSYTNKELAINTIKSMLTTSAPACRNIAMSEVIIDCFRYRELYCTGYVDSCDFLNQTSVAILDQTVSEWGRDYLFYVYERGDEGTFESSLIRHTNTEDNCYNAVEIEPGDFYLPAGGTTVFIRLDLCVYE